MRRLSLYILIGALFLGECINAPRDNKYDPKNPDKAYLSGHTCEPDGSILSDVIVKLHNDDNIIQVDTSDVEGIFEFDEITPDIYKISAETQYYTRLEIYPESLWAGTADTNYDIYFTTFDFEDEQAGTTTPYGFSIAYGSWRIDQDFQQPEKHSVAQVLNIAHNDTTERAIAFYHSSIRNFLFDVKFKILNSSGNQWEAGIILRYQDESNYHSIRICSDTVSFITVKGGNEVQRRTNIMNVTKNIWHSLEADCEEHLMIIRLDDEFMFTVIDGDFLSGLIGLWALNQQTGTTTSVHFDDVTIRLKNPQ
jgi:hypothetical protein